MAHRILIVSDDSRLLDTHKGLLADDFTVETVPGSTRALATMQMFGPGLEPWRLGQPASRELARLLCAVFFQP